MNLKQVTAMLLAVTMLTAGAVGAVAATPGNGNAPDDAGSQADEQAQDGSTDAADSETNEPAQENREADAANASDRADEGTAPADSAGERGPPSDLPEQVPDHVSQIHDTINSYLDGDIENLGEALSDVTPGEDVDGEDAENEDQTTDDTDDEDTEEVEDDSDGEDDVTPTATA